MGSRWLTLGVTCAALIALEGVARADELLSLAWTAPAECPSKDAVRVGAMKMVPASAAPRASLEARGVVSKDASGTFHAEIEVGAGDQASTRTLDGESCAAVADAVELMLAIAIDPSAITAPREKDEPAPPPKPSTPRSTRVVVAASGLVDSGMFGAGAAPGAEIAAGIGSRRVVVEVDGAWIASARATLPTNTREGASAWVGHVGARGCAFVLDRAIDFGPCAGAGLEWIVASGFGAATPSDVTAMIFVPTGGGRLVAALTPEIAIRAGAEAAIPLSRPTFVIDNGGTVSHTPALAVRASAGLEVRF